MKEYRGRVHSILELRSGVLLQTEHRAGTLAEAHKHESAYRSVVLAGGYTEHVPFRAPRRTAANTVIEHATGEEHGDYFHTDSLVLNVELFDGHTLEELAREARRLAPDDALRALLSPMAGARPRGAVPSWARTLEGDFDWCARRPLERAAEAVDLHPTHLSRAFRAHFGRTMCSYRDERRAEFVARQLTETNESLSAIAHDAGYADQSHMTSTFASLSGMTPAKFRDLFRR